MRKDLPKGWELINVHEAAKELFAGGDVPKNRMSKEWTEEFQIPIYGNGLSESGLYGFTDVPKVDQECITISARGTIGFPVYRTTPFYPIVRLIVLIPKPSLNTRYIFYYLKSVDFINTGTSIPQLTVPQVKQLNIPLPPLPEQQRIIAKLDAVFGHLDRVREKLDRIPELLKNFRQQVLTQAVTGELTREWREGKDLREWEENLISFLKERETVFFNSFKIKTDKIRKPEYINHPLTDLKKAAIQGWLKGPIGLICDSIVPGRDKPKSFSGEIPWVTMPILKNEIINKTDAELFLTEEEIQSAKAKVIPNGSVVMSIVGRFGIASILNCEAVINQQLHAFLPCPILAPKFLFYQILTSEKYLNDISTSTTVAYINKTNANSLPVNIPPIEEQEEIIKQVETLFSLADKIESQYQSLKAKTAQLPQAVLAKAFRGELVGQEVKEYVREAGEVLMAAEEVEPYQNSANKA